MGIPLEVGHFYPVDGVEGIAGMEVASVAATVQVTTVVALGDIPAGESEAEQRKS